MITNRLTTSIRIGSSFMAELSTQTLTWMEQKVKVSVNHHIFPWSTQTVTAARFTYIFRYIFKQVKISTLFAARSCVGCALINRTRAFQPFNLSTNVIRNANHDTFSSVGIKVNLYLSRSHLKFIGTRIMPWKIDTTIS